MLLVRNETSPEDLRGMIAAEGILTAQRRRQFARGARRAADGQGLRLRRERRCRSITRAKTMTVDGQTYKEGDFLSIRRHGRRSLSGRNQDRGVGNRPGARREIARGRRKARPTRSSRKLMDWCAKVTQAAGPHQRGHAGTDRERGGVRRDAASAFAARSTCSSKAIASTRCAK